MDITELAEYVLARLDEIQALIEEALDADNPR